RNPEQCRRAAGSADGGLTGRTQWPESHRKIIVEQVLKRSKAAPDNSHRHSTEATVMALVRYQPNSLLQQFNNEINRMFSGDWPVGSTAQWTPAVDIRESEEGYTIEAE